MTSQAAQALVQQLQWDFPSSSGRPVKHPASTTVARAVEQRHALAQHALALSKDGQHAQALEVAAAAWRLWILAHQEAAGRTFLAAVLDAPGALVNPRARALALYGDGLLAFRLGDLAASRARNAAALEAARTSADDEALTLALLGLSRVELSDGNHARALELAQQSREAAAHLDRAYGQAPLHMHAQAARALGDSATAAELFRQSLALNRTLGDAGMVTVELHNLGHVELRLGNVDAAAALFAQCAAPDDGTDPYGVAMTRFNQASVALARGDRAGATRLLQEARAGLAGSGTQLASDDAAEFQRLEQQLRDP